MRDVIAVRSAAAEHAESISRVICDAIRQVNAMDYPPAEIDRLIANFSTSKVLQFLGQRQTLVAIADGVVVGTGALQGDEIKSVFVAPHLHRKGVGRVLVKELEKIAVGRGKTSLTVSSSLTATSFYSALGYIEKARQFYGDEETVIMSKLIK